MLIYGLLAGIASVFANESLGQEEFNLGEIIVTNRRASFYSGRATENVSVLTEDKIKDLPARNLSEVLSYITGVDIEPRQGFGRGTSISIQGSDSRQVRVMIDGIPLNNQASGQVDPTRFPIDNIARIEVIKGASSHIWGSALGGVINVITKDTGTTLIPHGSITNSFAEFHTRNHNADLSGKINELGYYIFSSYMESGGEGARGDVLEKKAFGKLSYDLGNSARAICSFGYSAADVNSGEFPADSTVRWQAQPYRFRYGKITWEGHIFDAETIIDVKHSRQDIITRSYLSIDTEDPFWTTVTKDVLYELSINSTLYPRGRDLFVFGADFDWGGLKSNIYLSEEKTLSLQAPYCNYTLRLGTLDFNFGLRYDNNSEFGQEVSPSFGWVYHLDDATATLIRATVSRGFNAPPLLWKYNDDVALGIAPNPDIKAERAWVYELGLESKLVTGLWIKFSLYRADISNAISLAENKSGLLYMKNFEKFRRQGADLQLRIKVTEWLSFFGAAVFNDIENRATGETVRGGGKPRQGFDIGIEYKSKSGFAFSLLGNYNRWNEPADYQPNDRKMLLDAKLSQRFKHLATFLNIYNLTNTKYWADYFFPVPERYFEGGFTINW